MAVATLSSAMRTQDSPASSTHSAAGNCLILARAAEHLPADIQATLSPYTLVCQPSVYHFAAYLAQQPARAIVVDAVTLTQHDVQRLAVLIHATGVPLWLLPFRGPAAIVNALQQLNAVPWANVRDTLAVQRNMIPAAVRTDRCEAEFLVDRGALDEIAAQQSLEEQSDAEFFSTETPAASSADNSEPFSDEDGPLLSADELKALLQ